MQQLITSFFTDFELQCILTPLWLVVIYFILANFLNIQKTLLNTGAFLVAFILSYSILFMYYEGYNAQTNLTHFLFYLYIMPFFSILAILAWLVRQPRRNFRQLIAVLICTVIIEVSGFAFLMLGFAEDLTMILFPES